MIFEVEDETRDFITIFRKDFPPKKTEKRKECRPQPVYPFPLNILNGPFKRYLNTRRKNATLPLEEQSEDPQETLNRIREKHANLKKCLPEVIPDEDLIEREDNKLKQTVYQLDYSEGVYSPRTRKHARYKDIRLPEDWIISETMQKKSYRNPWKIARGELLRVKKAKKPADNLTACKKEREILRVRTGDTEYDAVIAATGKRVMKERLLGLPLSLEPQIYTKGPDSPQSECSKVLAQKKFAIPSNVL